MIAAGQQTVTSAAAGGNNRDEPNNTASSPPKMDDNDQIQRVANFLQEALNLADEYDFHDEPTPMQQQQEKNQREDERLAAPTSCTSVCTSTTATSPCISLSVSLEDDDDQPVKDGKIMKTPLRSMSCDLSPTTTRPAHQRNRSLRRSITTPLEPPSSTDTTDTTLAMLARRNRSKSSPSRNTSSFLKKTCPVKMPARRTNSADNLRELMAREVPDHEGVSGLKRQSPCSSITKLCRQTTDTTSSSYSVDKSARMPKRSTDTEEQQQTTTTTTQQVVVDTSLVAQHHANSRKDEDDASSLSSDDEDDVSSSSCSTIGSEELSELIDLSNWQNHHHLRCSGASSAARPPTRLSHHTITTVTSKSSFSIPQRQQQYGCCAGSVCTYTTNGTGPARPWICVCEEENDYDFAFCGMCGAPQKWTCTHCQFPRNKNRASFCGGCGMRR